MKLFKKLFKPKEDKPKNIDKVVDEVEPSGGASIDFKLDSNFFAKVTHKEARIAFHNNPLNIVKMPKALQSEYWDKAINEMPMLYALSPREVKRNKDMALKSVSKEPILYMELPNSFRDDVDIQKALVESGKDTIFKTAVDSLNSQEGAPDYYKNILDSSIKLSMKHKEEQRDRLEEVNKRAPKKEVEKPQVVRPIVRPAAEVKREVDRPDKGRVIVRTVKSPTISDMAEQPSLKDIKRDKVLSMRQKRINSIIKDDELSR